MIRNRKTKDLVITALFTALTCVATMVIQIPTLNGYIHLGDSLVILSGVLLGPLSGAFAGGIGSMFADLLTGYFIPYGPATLLIKALAALLAGLIFHKVKMLSAFNAYIRLILAGTAAAFVVVIGYGIFGILLYGFAAGIATVLPNLFQVLMGIAGAMIFFPFLTKIPDISQLVKKGSSKQ